MIPFNHRFISYEKHVGSWPVLITGGGRLWVAGIWAILVDGLGVVCNVLHVPSLRVVLMSPQRLVDDLSCSFHLRLDGMFLSDKVGKTTSIRRERGLLLLDDGGCSCFMVDRGLRPVAEQRRSRLHLTHQWLGHPSFSTLRRLFPSLCTGLDPKTVICEACQLAKHRRASFTPSISHTTTPFFQIHNDAWGPAPQAGLKGHRWFLIFVDEATLYTWTYLLIAKSAVAAKIQQFCTMIETQLGCRIQHFCSDNAHNFFNANMSLFFFASKGILHESSSVATPEQNSIAERRTRYITSTAHTLLLNYSVPYSYWARRF